MEKTIERDEIIKFLNDLGIETQLLGNDDSYKRTIAFKVYGIDYRIVWFVNQCTLEVGAHDRSAKLPFNYMYLDTTYPLVGGNKSIGFSYHKLERESIWDREYPFEVFRIPIEITPHH